MMRLVIFALVVAAAWYGWKHYPEMMHKAPGHDAVVENRSGNVLERVRVSVGGQGFVKETLADGESVSFPFKVDQDASFDLLWNVAGKMGEKHWSGGMVARGPMVQRHVMQIDGDNEVIYHAEPKLAATAP